MLSNHTVIACVLTLCFAPRFINPLVQKEVPNQVGVNHPFVACRFFFIFELLIDKIILASLQIHIKRNKEREDTQCSNYAAQN